MLPTKQNVQRIVFEKGGAPLTLISSLAWMHTHGNVYNDFTISKLVKIAKSGKLFLTCCHISRLSRILLKKEGFQVRVVNVVTLQDLNTYDNGHCMIEVFLPKSKRWVLFDVDNGTYFTHKGIQLSLEGFLKYSQNENYSIQHIANSTRLDVSNFKATNSYSFAFFAEGAMANLKHWYKRVVQVGGPVKNNIVYYTTK